MAVILTPTSGGAPPKSLGSGSWPATTMRTGKWSFIWTSGSASSSMSAGDYVWYEFGETDDALYLNITGGVATFRIWNGGDVFTRTFSFTAALAMTFTVDVPLQEVTIAGATTGNGTQGATFSFAAGDGSLDIGQYHTGIQVMPGTFGVVEDFTAAITCTAAATVPELVVAATGALTIASTGAVVVPELQVSAAGTAGTLITGAGGDVLVTSAPQVVAGGAWPAAMGALPFYLDFTPNYNSGAHVDAFQQLLNWSGNGIEVLITYAAGTTTLTAIVPGPNASRAITFSAGQTMRLTLDFAGGSLTVSGATTGDGAATFTPASLDYASPLYIGSYDGASDLFEGTIGNIYAGGPTVPTPTVAATGTLTITCAAAVAVPELQVIGECAVGAAAITCSASMAVPALVVAATCVNQSTITCTAAVVVPALVVETEPRLLIPTALTVYAPDGTTVVDVEGTINDDGAPRLSVDRVRNALRRGELLTQDDETF